MFAAFHASTKALATSTFSCDIARAVSRGRPNVPLSMEGGTSASWRQLSTFCEVAAASR
jgi:hypothetical protein